MKKCFSLALLLVLAGCATTPPQNPDNLCSTFREKDEWYESAHESYQRWGVPVAVQMAIMHQESHFVADARPPRIWLLGFIPWFRPSSAYGYAQALDDTWDDYTSRTGNWGADRDDFADACDFIGWYGHVSQKKLGISKKDARNLYLAYHEGHQGFQQKTHMSKPWLRKVADKVAMRARVFQQQLSKCTLN